MKKYNCILLFLFITVAGFGQGKFFGGSGDGFAVSEISVTLPVQWISFDVKRQTDHALLTWEVITGDITSFTIEAGKNGIHFEPVGNKPAENSTIPVIYTYADVPRTGVWYYRLSWTEKNGQVIYSKIIAVMLPGNETMTVYYDPPGNFIYIQKPAAVPVIEMYSIDGRLQQRLVNANTSLRLPVDNLLPGVYILKISGGTSGQQYTARFIKTR